MKFWGFVVAAIALLVAGCGRGERDGDGRVVIGKAIDTVRMYHLDYTCDVYLFNVGGHEYIWLDGLQRGGLIHSESCSSPTHIKQ